MSEIACLQDIEDYAHKVLPKKALGYYRSGAGSETTVKNNRTAFTKLRIKPKILNDVSSRDLTTTVLGTKVSMPIGIAPTAMQKMAHPEGECANARAAQQMGTIFILSTISTSSIEEVAEAAPLAIKWFQLYIYRDREVTKNLVKRAEKSGYKALVLTVDSPFFGLRFDDIRNNFCLPPHLQLANFLGAKATDINNSTSGSGLESYVRKLFDPSIQWSDVEWLKSITTLPIILKGILNAEDAIKGVNLGATGILVSNHGGRQVDSVPASIEALPKIVKAVGHLTEVYVDGGFREGSDVLKGLALGAKMVFMGRPFLWGLAYNGEEGVKKVLALIRTEFDYALALTGCKCVSEITSDMVVHESYYAHL